ncbi:MAG: hypothetical protein K0S53_2862 [Bacteroidetes bacterium]|jgi:hypothetical protein|nr:hypothetical protein [Bacteroidota bacterium]MDF2452911.1 hypothetical protein [Bacteroidota bacterium]
MTTCFNFKCNLNRTKYEKIVPIRFITQLD